MEKDKRVIVIGVETLSPEIDMLKEKYEVIIISNTKTNTFNIDGIEYTARPKTRVGKIKSYQLLLGLAIIAKGMIGEKEPERPDVDIITEFGLIQKKLSKLSANQRKWVVQEFNSEFKEVKQ